MIMRQTLGQFETITEQIKARIQAQIGDLLKQRQRIVDLETRLKNLMSQYANNLDKIRTLQGLYGKLNAYKTQQDSLESTVQTVSRQVSTGTTPTLSASLDIAKLAYNINDQIANIDGLDKDVKNIEVSAPVLKETIPDFLVKAFIIGTLTVIISAIAGRVK